MQGRRVDEEGMKTRLSERRGLTNPAEEMERPSVQHSTVVNPGFYGIYGKWLESDCWLQNYNFHSYEVHNICPQQQNRHRWNKLWSWAPIKEHRPVPEPVPDQWCCWECLIPSETFLMTAINSTRMNKQCWRWGLTTCLNSFEAMRVLYVWYVMCLLSCIVTGFHVFLSHN